MPAPWSAKATGTIRSGAGERCCGLGPAPGLQLPGVRGDFQWRQRAPGCRRLLYFIARRDEMMKTSGWVSPTEVENPSMPRSWSAMRGLRRRPPDSGPGDPGDRHAGSGRHPDGAEALAPALLAECRASACRPTWSRPASRSCAGRCCATRTARSTASCCPLDYGGRPLIRRRLSSPETRR